MKLRAIVGASLITVPCLSFSEEPRSHVGTAVLVSRASSGIGRKIAEHLTSGGYKDSAEVAAAAALALPGKAPKARCLAVANQLEAKPARSSEITSLVQANEGQAYTYDRQDIVALLDEPWRIPARFRNWKVRRHAGCCIV